MMDDGIESEFRKHSLTNFKCSKSNLTFMQSLKVPFASCNQMEEGKRQDKVASHSPGEVWNFPGILIDLQTTEIITPGENGSFRGRVLWRQISVKLPYLSIFCIFKTLPQISWNFSTCSWQNWRRWKAFLVAEQHL